MSYYFNRVCRVVIEGCKEIDISENKISFELTKSSNSRENLGRIEIWNLSSETRKLITSSDSLVRVFAGYTESMGLVEIAQGDITNIRHNRNKTDTVTQIYIEDGNKKLRQNPISISFKGEVRLTDILAKLKIQSGLSFRLAGVASNASVSSGYSAMGGLDLVLNQLATIFNCSWSMQGGSILIRGQEATKDESVLLLSAETGLIFNPETVKQISEKLVDSDEPLPPSIYAVQSLLQPHLQVNDLIILKSQDLNGSFRIKKISHTGDTRGNDWYSNIEVIAL
jgi:hypothetical protein